SCATGSKPRPGSPTAVSASRRDSVNVRKTPFVALRGPYPPAARRSSVASPPSARHEWRRQDRQRPKGGDIPEQRANEWDPGDGERGVCNASREIGHRAPVRQRIVNARRLGGEDCGGEEWERLHIVAEVAADASGDGLQRRHFLIARACCPFEAVLNTRGLGRHDELHEAPERRSCQHRKLEIHHGPVPLSEAVGTLTFDLHISAALPLYNRRTRSEETACKGRSPGSEFRAQLGEHDLAYDLFHCLSPIRAFMAPMSRRLC